ncbi:MAG TPA: hypothetical protein VFU72_07045, partial [Nitrolancea sp.]|nr:hypothetical protein [Nitrolancea sp.]
MSRPAHRPVRVAFVLLCLTLALTLVPFAGRQAAAAGPGALVAYLDRGNNLWVSNPDGSSARQLTPGGFGAVAWSPDGSRLAAAGPYNGGQGVYLTSPDGSLKLTPLSAGAKPAWAPDSGDLALINSGTIAVFSRDGVAVRSAAVGADTLRWSPNAHIVGYTRIVADPYGTNCPVR